MNAWVLSIYLYEWKQAFLINSQSFDVCGLCVPLFRFL